jgi:hypothetical protein
MEQYTLGIIVCKYDLQYSVDSSRHLFKCCRCKDALGSLFSPFQFTSACTTTHQYNKGVSLSIEKEELCLYGKRVQTELIVTFVCWRQSQRRRIEHNDTGKHTCVECIV